MHEGIAAFREVNQPPEKLYEALLVSSDRDSIPIDNQTVEVFQFTDPGSLDFIDITSKTDKIRLLQDDPRIYETLGEMGCKVISRHEWDESFVQQPPPHVISGGEWDIMDKTDSTSLVLASDKHGTIPEPSDEGKKLEVFTIPVDILPIYYQLEGREVRIDYPNAQAVEIEEFPEMSHVIIHHQDSEGRKGASVLFGDSELAGLLFEEGFPYTIRRYPDGQIVSLFLNCEEDTFAESAAELLGDSPDKA